MSNVEHLFENALDRYALYGDSSFESLEADCNCEGLTQEEIDAVYACAVYVFDNLFSWDQNLFRDIRNRDL